MKLIDKYNNLGAKLSRFDSDSRDQKLTFKEFKNLHNDTATIQALTNDRRTAVVDGELNLNKQWADFKNLSIEFLGACGFSLKPLQGQGGPIEVSSVTLPKELGIELAETVFAAEITEGDFNGWARKELSQLFGFFVDEKQVNLTEVRRGFTEYENAGKSYRFKQGRGSQFNLLVNEFVFLGNKKTQDEFSLGELIRDPLKDALKLSGISHTQTERNAEKYRNVDFIGYRIERGLLNDDFAIFAFELKPTNRISQISEAISQAINYKSSSNYSYIVIPMFDEGLFGDDARFLDLRQMCASNGIGIVTITFDPMRTMVESVYEVLPATYSTHLDEEKRQKNLVERKLEVCPLCKRIVSSEPDRSGCGWMVTAGAENLCMRDLFEKSMTRTDS